MAYNEEAQIQIAFMDWFRYQYPQYSLVCFHPVNEGKRNTKMIRDRYGNLKVVCSTGAMLKREGLVAGVADIVLLVPRGGYGCLCIEFKTPTGRQSAEQVRWQEQCEAAGNKYIIVRSAEEAIAETNEYLHLK